MFGKKACKGCKRKISSKYNFCPYCGIDTQGNSKKAKDEWGMLGKDDSFDDFMNEFENFSRAFFGGIGGKMINKMIGSAVKMLEKEIEREMEKEMMREKKSLPKTSFQLFINGKRVPLSAAPDTLHSSVNSGSRRKSKKETSGLRESMLPQNTLENFASLPKKEPSTNIRRLSNKVIYEVNLPGVKSVNDISLMKLENSIELKAVGKDVAYFKPIPISLPVINYKFSKEKLILEFGVKG